jgi:hypothetical protein
MHDHALSSFTRSPDPRTMTPSPSFGVSSIIISIKTPWGYTLPSLHGIGLVCNDPIEVDSERSFGIETGESRR